MLLSIAVVIATYLFSFRDAWKFDQIGNSLLKFIGQTEAIWMSSTIDNFELTPKNQKYLQKLLNDARFWDQSSVILIRPSGLQTESITVRKLQLIFTDQEQPLGQVYNVNKNGEQILAQSFGMNYDKVAQSLTLFVALNPEIIRQKDVNEVSRMFSGQLLLAIFRVTHPKGLTQANDENLTGMFDYIRRINEVPGGTFVKIGLK